MWPFKKPENPNASSTPTPTIKFAEECTTCGCLVAQGRGRKVTDHRLWDSRALFYCEACAPLYDTVFMDSLGQVSFHKKVPEQLVEVTEGGKPVKSKGK